MLPNDIVGMCQTTPNKFPFWLETLSIFLGDVLATIFIGIGAYALWYLLKYPGFRVGANWTFFGWDMKAKGRLPNASDTESLTLMPNVSVASRDMNVKKVIAAIWVRERADLSNPGKIHGVRHLSQTGVPPVVRTTGGDVLSLTGPEIKCHASECQEIFFCPVFIQTSDGEFYQAESPGNEAKGIVKTRYALQKFFNSVKQRILRLLP